jgi:hypothetical protein
MGAAEVREFVMVQEALTILDPALKASSGKAEIEGEHVNDFEYIIPRYVTAGARSGAPE